MSTITGTLYVQTLAAGQFTPPAGCINDAAVAANAAVDASKLEHRYQQVYSQPTGSVGTTERKAVHVVHGATAVVNSFKVSGKTACAGAATITFDLQKNGSSILSGVVTLNSGSTAYALSSGTVTSPNLVAGDVLEVVVVSTAGGGTIGNGPFCVAQVDELAN